MSLTHFFGGISRRNVRRANPVVTVRTLIAGYFLLSIAVAVFAESSAPESANGDRLSSLIDSSQWTVMQTARVQFDNDETPALVRLLKAVRPAGEDGIGRPLYSANLLITVNGRVLYSFAPPVVPKREVHRVDPVYYLEGRGVQAGCPFAVRDVTGNGTPEILFCTGYAGASDWVVKIHVLRYVRNDPNHFRDVRESRFAESWWQKFRWVNRGSHSLAIVAEPIEGSGDSAAACHACPKLHRYDVYRWDEARASFVLSQTIPSTGMSHRADEDPMRTDWPYIISNLRE